MLKTLMKKQLMEVNVWLLVDKKRGTRRSKGGIVGYLLLYLMLFAFLGGCVYFLASALCPPLHGMGLDWLYFAMMGLLALLLGLFGSVFTTSETLYQSKDNTLLFSLPIPPQHILVARLSGIWLWNTIYTALVLVPALICYWVNCAVTVGAVVCGLAVLVLLSLLVLALSCALGWVVARLTAKLKRKSFFTVLLSLVFLAVYYLFYFKINEILQGILLHAEEVGSVMAKIFPFYWLGRACAGSGVSLFCFAALVGALLAIVLVVISRSLLRLATASPAAARKAYRRTAMKTASPDAALLRRELRRLTSSATYMMNCALGTLFLPVVGVIFLVKSELLKELAVLLPDGYGALIAAAVVCLLTSMNTLSAASVSLEGKQLWLAQSLPVQPWQVLRAKLKLHLLLTQPPAVICAVCISVALGLDVLPFALTVAASLLFVLLSAAFGLWLNLKMPNLTWTNETVPVKQSASVFFALFGGWIFVVALSALCFAVRSVLGGGAYLLVCVLLFAALSFVLLFRLKRAGARRFASL